MLKIASEMDISEINIVGDFLDVFNLSRHLKDPGVGILFEEEIDDGKLGLLEIRELFPKAKINYLEGNHEKRFWSYLVNNAPQLHTFISLPKLLELNQLRINWIPAGPTQAHRILGTDAVAKHIPNSESLHCAWNTLVKCSCPVLFGHTHRFQHVKMTNQHGQEYSGLSLGWLGDISRNDIFGFVKGHHTWNSGFAFVHRLHNSTYFEPIQIINNHAAFGGKLYK